LFRIKVDLRGIFEGVHRGALLTAGTIINPTGYNENGVYIYTRGWSFFLAANDQGLSNFNALALNRPTQGAYTLQGMRDFAVQMLVGNSFVIPANGKRVYDNAGTAMFELYDYVFAMDDYAGPIYFETAVPMGVGAGGATDPGRNFMFSITQDRDNYSIFYTTQGGSMIGGAARVRLRSTMQIYDPLTHTTRTATYAEVNALAPGFDFNTTALNMVIPGAKWSRVHLDEDPYSAIREDSKRLGAVFQSIKRISQHVCAPVINPNVRIGAIAPLNHDSRHLPPEMRDFRLQLQDIDWGRLRTDRVSIRTLSLYEFKDGVQKVGAEQNILYIPQFREFKRAVSGGAFELSIFSELGAPSYFAFFCRSATTDILQQPLIKQLSISCETTMKKSNVLTDVSIGELYHLTQRNVHPHASYDRKSFNRRQTILLSTEDVGLMGLKSHEYQKAKRVEYTFSGTTDKPGNLYVVLVYNNRGLHIDGRRLQLVTLHE
jgi:hypothetical protein